MSICVLSHTHVKRWQETAIRPPCEFHHHMPFGKADQMVNNDEANWVGQQEDGRSCAIVIHTCVTDYSWKGANSGGFQVLQLVPIKPKARMYSE